jgi:hypothetical protein
MSLDEAPMETCAIEKKGRAPQPERAHYSFLSL